MIVILKELVSRFDVGAYLATAFFRLPRAGDDQRRSSGPDPVRGGILPVKKCGVLKKMPAGLSSSRKPQVLAERR
jgi:hypothetical protein